MRKTPLTNEDLPDGMEIPEGWGAYTDHKGILVRKGRKIKEIK